MIHYSEFNIESFSPSLIHDNKGRAYCNDIFTFDIETSTAFFIAGKWRKFYFTLPKEYYNQDTPKLSWCYIWQFGINDTVVYGRRLEEFKVFFEKLVEHIQCTPIVYVHNLAYEMQYLRNIFEITKVFARKQYKPMKFEACGAIWKCSFMLSRLSLADIGNKINKTYKKKEGDLKYDILRFSDTILTKKEMEYCENDILVMYEYLLSTRMSYENNILHIPLTQTGKVRKRINKIFKGDLKYHNLCKSLTPNYNEFFLLRECFTGGLTRANATWTGFILRNVTSKDETSAYPYAMLVEKYPCTHFRRIDVNACLQIEQQVKQDEHWIARVRFKNIRSKSWLKYISTNKCTCTSNQLADNGRIARADEISITINEVQYDIINKTYKYDEMIVEELYVAKGDYLNDKYRNLIIELFNDKNSLKGVEDMETIYLNLKEMLNSLYGMMVTNFVTPDVTFDINKGWDCDTENFGMKNVLELLEKQRHDNKNLTVYSNGVYVTSYAQRYLVDMALRIGPDVAYLDTDSLKYINNHDAEFEEYNLEVIEKLKKSLSPEQVDKLWYIDNGNKYYIGQFTPDGNYKEFRTWGAKKYAYTKDVFNADTKKWEPKLYVTVSGLNKKKSAESLNGDIRDFDLKRVFNYKESGRTISYYCDSQPIANIRGRHIDYKYGICLVPTTYTLGMSSKYEKYLELCIIEHEHHEWLNSRKEFEEKCHM